MSIGFYIRLRRSKTADTLTRKVHAVAAAEAKELGVHEILGVLPVFTGFVERGYERRALALIGQDPGERQIALQVGERRFVRGVPRYLAKANPLVGVTAFEWRAAWGTYTREWASLEATVG